MFNQLKSTSWRIRFTNGWCGCFGTVVVRRFCKLVSAAADSDNVSIAFHSRAIFHSKLSSNDVAAEAKTKVNWQAPDRLALRADADTPMLEPRLAHSAGLHKIPEDLVLCFDGTILSL